MDIDTPDNLENTRSEWEDDISLKDALREVNNAKARVNMKRKMKDFSKTLDLRRQEDRWRAMYDFLRRYNVYARRAIDDFNSDCERIRQEQKEWNASGKHMQFGLHFPQILWDALCLVDDEMAQFDTLDTEHQRKIYRKLGKAFPMYWMPRV